MREKAKTHREHKKRVEHQLSKRLSTAIGSSDSTGEGTHQIEKRVNLGSGKWAAPIQNSQKADAQNIK